MCTVVLNHYMTSSNHLFYGVSIIHTVFTVHQSFLFADIHVDAIVEYSEFLTRWTFRDACKASNAYILGQLAALLYGTK
jgi:hypothetical protein